MKVCVVSSCGGHLTEVCEFKTSYGRYPHIYVLNDQADLPDDMKKRTYFITHSERDWRLLVNIYEAYVILKREKPSVILSTGAGPVVPFALVGRWLFCSHIIFVETFTRVGRPSLTGRIMYWLAHDFFYHWPSQSKYFPSGTCGGSIL
ncbi:MAG: hypothetical protein AAGB04_10305 [Pseudomonadota bacterium]